MCMFGSITFLLAAGYHVPLASCRFPPRFKTIRFSVQNIMILYFTTCGSPLCGRCNLWNWTHCTRFRRNTPQPTWSSARNPRHSRKRRIGVQCSRGESMSSPRRTKTWRRSSRAKSTSSMVVGAPIVLYTSVVLFCVLLCMDTCVGLCGRTCALEKRTKRTFASELRAKYVAHSFQLKGAKKSAHTSSATANKTYRRTAGIYTLYNVLYFHT